MSHLVGDLKHLLDIRVQESWRAIFRPATERVVVAVGRNSFVFIFFRRWKLLLDSCGSCVCCL